MRRDELLRILQSHTAELGRHGVKSLRRFGPLAHDEAADGSDVDLVTESGLRDRVRPYVEKGCSATTPTEAESE